MTPAKNNVKPPPLHFSRVLLGLYHTMGGRLDNRMEEELLCANPACEHSTRLPPLSYMLTREKYRHRGDVVHAPKMTYGDMQKPSMYLEDKTAMKWLDYYYSGKGIIPHEALCPGLTDAVDADNTLYVDFNFNYGISDSNTMYARCSPYEGLETTILDIHPEDYQFFPSMWSVANCNNSARWYESDPTALMHPVRYNDFPRFVIKYTTVLSDGEVFTRHKYLWSSTPYRDFGGNVAEIRTQACVLNEEILLELFHQGFHLTGQLYGHKFHKSFVHKFKVVNRIITIPATGFCPEILATQDILCFPERADDAKEFAPFHKDLHNFLRIHQILHQVKCDVELAALLRKKGQALNGATNTCIVTLQPTLSMRDEDRYNTFSSLGSFQQHSIGVRIHPSSQCDNGHNSVPKSSIKPQSRIVDPKLYNLEKGHGTYAWATHAVYCCAKCCIDCKASLTPKRANYNLDLVLYLALPYKLRANIGKRKRFSDVTFITQN